MAQRCPVIFFHCQGNYDAVYNCGNTSESQRIAEEISSCREEAQDTGLVDSQDDQKANQFGRNGGNCEVEYTRDWLYWKCEFDKARKHFESILKQSSLSDFDMVRCYKSLGAIGVELKNYDDALEMYNKQLDILEKSDFSNKNQDILLCYRSIAVEYFQKVLEIDGERLRKDHPQFGQTYANIAIMYQSKQNYQEALIFYTMYILLVDQRSTTTIEASVEHIQPVNPSDILTLNNVMIIWLDEHIGRDENCRDLKNEFRQITNSFKMFDSVESCRRCLPHVKNRKIFFIIQGKHAKEIVPDIVEIMSSETKPVVYLFCLNIIYLIEWAEEQECIMEGGIFDDEKHLLATLTNDMKDYIKQKSDEHNKYISMDMISIFLTEL
ncbi:hypothetical protein I4U23_016154 [Adineta vaga]|nr:hypothetical protein I4U23_016154 [Adineta vaga]